MFEIFAPLHNKQYRLFFTAHTIALLGTGLSTIALALFAYNMDKGRAAEIISFALAAKMVAYICVAPIIGAYAHKLPRKYMMIFFDIMRAAILFALPFASEAWHIYVMIFAINICGAGFTPLYQATLPSIFRDEVEYGKALSLSRMTYDLENLLSPTLAAILLLTLDFSSLFQLNAAAFLVSAVALSIVIFPANIASDRKSGIWHNVSFGVKSYLKTPRLRGLLSFNFIAALAGALVIVNSAHYAQNIFGQDKGTTAMLFASVGLGSMVMAFGLPHLMKIVSIRKIMQMGAVLAIISLAGFILLPTLGGLFLVWFILGMASALLQTPSGLVIQQSSGVADRPAYFSAQFTLTHLGWLFAYLIAGQISQYMAIDMGMLVLAVASVVMLLVALRFWHLDDAVKLTHTHAETQHLHPHIHDEHHQHEHEGWEGPEPHVHEHRHPKVKHVHDFYIDEHHLSWPH
ncbi:MAG: MFS transporter [Alphaproteobacteria bacterium]|nr:MFS transporter [Alphaproteobacteria bacterium]